MKTHPLLTALIVVSAITTPAAELRKPNIVLILADDLGYGDVGCFGQQKIRTPNIDRMAAEGLRLTHHYGGNAVCAPSRCVLMTGKNPGHALIRENKQFRPGAEGQLPIPPDTVTLPKLLQAQGYVTGGFGKWGLGGPGTTGEPLKQGFDRWFGYNCQAVAHNYYPTYLWDNDAQITLKNVKFSAHDKFKPGEDPTKPESYKRFQSVEYSADLIAAQAREFVRNNQDRPFFLYWPTTVPHLALQVPDDSVKEYAGLWDDPPYTGGKGYLPNFAPRAAYAAMISRFDSEVGRVMAMIKEFGLDENTIFIFSSDQGPLHGRYEGLGGTDSIFFDSTAGLRDGKATLYEGGIRVPTIVRWAGTVKAGVTSTRVTGFEDWMPTLLELIGAKGAPPRNIDGISFAPTILGKPQAERAFLYREYPGYGGSQCVRIGDWKGIRSGLKQKGKNAKPNLHVELYNLRDDIAETRDISGEHPDIVAKIEQIMNDQHTPSKEFPLPALDPK